MLAGGSVARAMRTPGDCGPLLVVGGESALSAGARMMGKEESQWLSFLSEEERARIGKMCGSSCATCDDDRQAYRTVAALRALVAEQKKGLLAATDALDGVVK